MSWTATRPAERNESAVPAVTAQAHHREHDVVGLLVQNDILDFTDALSRSVANGRPNDLVGTDGARMSRCSRHSEYFSLGVPHVRKLHSSELY